jgi:beta-lactamase class A
MDIENNDSFGINESEEFMAASTFKIPLNLYVYKKIKEGKINPEGTLKYLKSDYEGGAGIIQTQAFGTKYTVRRLSELSVVKSDNVATNMLIRFVDKINVKNFMRSMGGTVVSNTKNISCPKDMALYMKNVYDFYKADDILGKELMNNFKNVELHDRLPALLPKGVEVAHKTGNLVGVVNDIGIVFAKKPYILVVMSKDVVSDEESNKIIANISKKVYEYVKDR